MKDFYAFATANPELVFFSFWIAVWGATRIIKYLLAPFAAPKVINRYNNPNPKIK